MNFKDKIVIITGGSKGFGRALAKAFSDEGSKVIITSDNETDLKASADELGVEYYEADVCDYDNTVSLADYVEKRFGSIDVWINNAGIQIAPTNVEEVQNEKLHKLFDINFFGYFYGCKVALKHMKKQGNGLIINVNSTAGLSGKPGLSAYVSSKFAIKGLTETLREELKSTNIDVFQVFPGGMQTDIYREQVPADIKDYMQVDYAIDKVMSNLKLETPEQDLVIKRPV